jgi:anti-sigma B factor antagonist
MLIKIVHTQPRCAELTISGELDMATTDELLRTATAALADNACDDLVLDLSEVSFIDSTGLGTLVAIRNATRDRAVTLHLREPTPPVRRLMKITNLDSVFNISNSQS